MLRTLRGFLFPRGALSRHGRVPAQPSAAADDALGLVTALFNHECGSPESIRDYEERWDAIDDQMRAVFTLTMLLGTMIGHEAVRRDQSLQRVINQIRSDIAGDEYAHELGIQPRD